MSDGQGQVPPADGQAPSDDQSQEDFDKERALATIQKLREFEKQAKQQAKELEELKAKQREAEEAKLKDQQKWQELAEQHAKRAEELEREKAETQARLQAERAKAAVERTATKLGFADPEDAYLMLQHRGTLERDDAGNPINVEPALKALLKDKPYLAMTKTSVPGTPATPKPGSLTPDDLVKQAEERLRRSGRYAL